MRLWIQAAMVVAGLAGGLAPAAAQTPFRPVATVNKSLITAYDVDQRARIIAALGAATGGPDELGNLALDQLIEDRLKLQAATDVGLEPTPEVIAAGVAEIAGQLGVSAPEFRDRLRGAGVSDQAIADLVTGQMLWREVVRERFRGRVELGEAEIDAEIALRAGGGLQSFRFTEIGLPFRDGGRTEAETRALADRLHRELSAGGDFEAAVATYSRAPSVPQGGDVGWVAEEDVPPPLLRQIAALPVGAVLPPQAVPGGLAILRLADRRVEGSEEAAADPLLRERVRRELIGQRLELLSQGLIQELRRDAMIELR